MKKNFKRSGFTLIEILIVIAIIGILAVAFLPNLLNAPSKARDAKRIADLDKIASLLLNEYVRTGQVVDTDGNDMGCIKQGSNSKISLFIEANLDELGGVFPNQPSKEIYGINRPDIQKVMCEGGYFYSDTYSPYLFLISSEVEDPSSVWGVMPGHYTISPGK